MKEKLRRLGHTEKAPSPGIITVQFQPKYLRNLSWSGQQPWAWSGLQDLLKEQEPEARAAMLALLLATNL